MAPDGKALLDFGKALPRLRVTRENKAMLSTADALKQKMAEVLAGGVKQSEIAAHCGVSKQAVQSWKNTGRIDKRHLQALAEVTGRPLSWWLELGDDHLTYAHPNREIAAKEAAPAYASLEAKWPFKKIGWQDYALLNDHQKNLVEAYARGLLDEALRNKSDGKRHAA